MSQTATIIQSSGHRSKQRPLVETATIGRAKQGGRTGVRARASEAQLTDDRVEEMQCCLCQAPHLQRSLGRQHRRVRFARTHWPVAVTATLCVTAVCSFRLVKCGIKPACLFVALALTRANTGSNQASRPTLCSSVCMEPGQALPVLPGCTLFRNHVPITGVSMRTPITGVSMCCSRVVSTWQFAQHANHVYMQTMHGSHVLDPM